MKTKLLSSISLLLFVGIQLFAQTSGGPDTYGYTWKNSADASGPAFNWKDIKGKGTQISGLADDNQSGPFNINWNFKFYWNDYSKFWVGANGFISFQNLGNVSSPFLPLPWANAKNTISPMMSDLTYVDKNSAAVAGTSVWYWSNNVDTLIVQYDSIPYWVGTGLQFSGRYTFQAIMSGVDNSITFQYKITQAGTAYSMASEHLITGIENSTGSIALQVLNDVFPAANTAVKFYYPNPVTYQVSDVAPAWNQYADDKGFFVSRSHTQALTMQTDIANTGNQSVGAIPVMGQIVDAASTPVWTDNANVASLTAGADVTLNFPTTYMPNLEGDYTYRTTTSLGSDINNGNDIHDAEMVVVDTTLADVQLTYSSDATTMTGLGWAGGNGGGAVYFVPPFYPVNITSLDYFIAGNAGLKDFTAQIIAADGPNGDPGTVLFTSTVPAASVVEQAYNNVPVTYNWPNTTIRWGGVYVAWLEGGDSISVGTSTTPPFSYRNMEFVSGQWAPYRDNSAADIMIRMNVSNATAVNEVHSGAALSISPNPFTTSAQVKIDFVNPVHNEVAFTLFDIYGKEIQTIDLSNMKGSSIDFTLNRGSNIASGLYFYRLKSSEGILSTGKIVVQ